MAFNCSKNPNPVDAVEVWGVVPVLLEAIPKSLFIVVVPNPTSYTKICSLTGAAPKVKVLAYVRVDP